MITSRNVHLKDAHKTPQFWCLWLVLCLNVSAGIGIIGAASPMLQETFGGKLFGETLISFEQFTADQKTLAAAVGAGFVGLISLFNIFGRIAWASSSDKLGRKLTYFVFFTLGAAMYVLAALAADWKSVALFVVAIAIIASMYGGGFATIPAYLADMFGTQFVGAIHGRLLTAWSTAGILGPVVVNYLHDTRIAEQIAYDRIYGPILYVMAGMLVVGWIANLLIRPVNPKWHMSEAQVQAVQAQLKSATAAPGHAGSYGIGKGRLDGKAAAFWLLVGLPLAWGVWNTVEKTLVLLQ
jgi:MFS family permease